MNNTWPRNELVKVPGGIKIAVKLAQIYEKIYNKYMDKIYHETEDARDEFIKENASLFTKDEMNLITNSAYVDVFPSDFGFEDSAVFYSTDDYKSKKNKFKDDMTELEKRQQNVLEMTKQIEKQQKELDEQRKKVEKELENLQV